MAVINLPLEEYIEELKKQRNAALDDAAAAWSLVARLKKQAEEAQKAIDNAGTNP